MVEENICPICGEYNNCRAGYDCWCKNYVIPSIVFYLTKDDKNCVCQTCIEHFANRGGEFKMLETIFTRRSIRKFTGKEIDDRDLKLILKAGFQAPSAMNREPREYIVVRDNEKLREIEEVHKYGKMLVEAGCGVVVCGDIDKQERLGHLIADCSASMENMLLAAHSLGLASVWTGIHPIEKLEEDIRNILDIPKNLIPIGLVVIGEGSIVAKTIDRYDESKIHYDKY